LGDLEAARAEEFRMETTELRLRTVKKELGVAVIKFGVNERGGDNMSSRKVESASYPSKITYR